MVLGNCGSKKIYIVSIQTGSEEYVMVSNNSVATFPHGGRYEIS